MAEEEKMEQSVVEQDLQGRVGFSSENFKMEIAGLPRFFGVGQIKKLLTKKLDIKFHKLKPCGPKATYMFVNFANEEDRDVAIAKLDGYMLKGKKLKAFKARAATDPMIKKQKREEEDDSKEEEDTRPPCEKLLSAVCPLAHLTYEEQLEAKMKEIEAVMGHLRTEFIKQNEYCAKHKGLEAENLAVLDRMIPSPVMTGYRNKCEFTVGRHPETGEVTVGFRLASYKKGSVAVVQVDNLPVVSDKMKRAVQKFERFVKQSTYEPYDTVSQKGHWKQLTLRTSKQDLMALAILHPQDMSNEDRESLRSSFKSWYADDPEVTSLNIQFFGQRQKGQKDPEVECLNGSPSIKEMLMEDLQLSFNVSPRAFFQINTKGAEVLFKTIADIANLDDETVLFDVCCGTGTIGLCLASKAKEVHGVDIIEEAVQDATDNALRNGIQNAQFHAGRAEFVLPQLLKQAENDKTVAIVDPPRAGLHPKAVYALRASNVQRLVYVSCDAKAAMNNFICLGRAPSKQYRGNPFIPRKVIPVDMFPHTKHFELVILFERFPLLPADASPETRASP